MTPLRHQNLYFLGNMRAEYQGRRIPPGFCSWNGLVEMASHAGMKTDDYGGSQLIRELGNLLDSARKFVRWFREFTSHIWTVFGQDRTGSPYCELLNEAYIEKEGFESRESLLFDTLVWKPYPRALLITERGFVRTELRFSRAMLSGTVDNVMEYFAPENPLAADGPKLATGTPFERDVITAMIQEASPEMTEQKNLYFPVADSKMPDYAHSGLYVKRVKKLNRPDMTRAFRSAFDIQAAATGNRVYNMAAQALNCSMINGYSVISMNAAGVRIPLGFMAVWPHRMYVTEKVVKLLRKRVGGVGVRPGTGCIQDDGEHRVHLLNIDFHAGSWVFAGENIVSAPNVYVKSYISGEDLTPLSPDVYNPEDENGAGGSVFFIVVPYDFRRKPVTLNLLGDLETLQNEFSPGPGDQDLSYPTAPFYNSLYGWRRNKLGSELRKFIHADIISYPQPIPVNGCRLMYHQRYSKVDRGFSNVVEGTDYWASSMSFEGCGQSRLGGVFPTSVDRGVFRIVPR